MVLALESDAPRAITVLCSLLVLDDPGAVFSDVLASGHPSRCALTLLQHMAFYFRYLGTAGVMAYILGRRRGV